MLIEFSVENYRSFKDRVTLNLAAAEIASQPPSLDEQNVVVVGHDVRLLKSAVIYGANAGGKSNLLQALHFMRDFVLASSRETQVGEAIAVEPFRLSTATEHQPSSFELVFLCQGTQYRYGFAATSHHVSAEWLYQLGSRREITLFTRTDAQISINSRNFREGRRLEVLTRPNALFLSVAAQFNGPTATAIMTWLESFMISSGLMTDIDRLHAIAAVEASAEKQVMVELIRRLDVGIADIRVERLPAAVGSVPRAGELLVVKTRHTKYDDTGSPVADEFLNMWHHESAGTQRLFTLAYPLLNALRHGSPVMIDELDARIHPNLVIELVRLFHDPRTNPHGAQLIFTTHNTNLLGTQLFRRDQVWFVEKTRQGASNLYSLVEYRQDGKIIRNDASFEKDYVAGRYGAVPFIGDLSGLLE